VNRTPDKAPPVDPFRRLRAATPARIGLGRCGHGLATAPLLEFQLAHARARDAVHEKFSPERLAADLGEREVHIVNSLAADRQTYLQRPDLGRRLRAADEAALSGSDSGHAGSASAARKDYEAAFVIADGLSPPAVHAHAAPLMHGLTPLLASWRIAPMVIACQARVALGDEVGYRLNAALVVVLIGERPGLSAPDSLGVYLTWQPRPGRQDSERNCISNIRPPTGLSYAQAASRLAWLMNAARAQRLTGVSLKDTSSTRALSP
jgi:ethanolamine ammonia-lyase small subunit